MSEIVEIRVVGTDSEPYYKCPVCGCFMKKTFAGFNSCMEEEVTDFECVNPKCKGFDEDAEDEYFVM